jgi:hypothetical protein
VYIIETNNFGNVKIEDDNGKFKGIINITENTSFDFIFKGLLETDEIINDLKNIIDNYYIIKNISEKYIIYNSNYYIKNELSDNIKWFFKRFFEYEYFYTHALIDCIKEMDELMALPIKDKIKHLKLPNLEISYNEEKQYKVLIRYCAGKIEYESDHVIFNFYYNKDNILEKFICINHKGAYTGRADETILEYVPYGDYFAKSEEKQLDINDIFYDLYKLKEWKMI